MTESKQAIEEILQAQRRKVVNPLIRALIVVVCIFLAPIFALFDAVEKRRQVP